MGGAGLSLIRDTLPSMLVELSVVEKGYQAVRLTGQARRGPKVRRWERGRAGSLTWPSGSAWTVAPSTGGWCATPPSLGALADRSSRPDRSPHQIAPAIEAGIVELRRAHSGWGPRTILSRLSWELESPPSRSSIHPCLLRHRLIEPTSGRRRPEDYKRRQRSRRIKLWQLEVMGGVLLDDGTECRVITGVDDHSTYCVMAKLALRATAKPVCNALPCFVGLANTPL